MTDLELLVRDKYEGDAGKVTQEDRRRLAAGEPLAYVIGWVPFLGLRIGLESTPLIPRPETEWWTELLIQRLKERFGDAPFRFLDLCAGSGAIGLSVLANFPRAHVFFGELMPEHCEQIKENIELNGLDAARADVRASDLFAAFDSPAADSASPCMWDVIASNPPYIPAARELPQSVVGFEPAEALYAGDGGLEIIRKIVNATQSRLEKGGEAWLECDVENIAETQKLLGRGGAKRTEILTDLYGRPRVVVAYYTQ